MPPRWAPTMPPCSFRPAATPPVSARPKRSGKTAITPPRKPCCAAWSKPCRTPGWHTTIWATPLRDQGSFAEAEACYRAALALAETPLALNHLAAVLRDLGRLAEAQVAAERGLALARTMSICAITLPSPI